MSDTPSDRGARRIEDYALIGNNHTAALVHRGGDIDWLCLPKFDSAAIFAALLGDDENGSWRLCASDPKARITRRYRPGTAILETRFKTRRGCATVIDFMPRPGADGAIELVRMVRGEQGAVDFETTIRFRFDYGQQRPWVRANPVGLTAIAGPDAVRLVSTVPLTNRDFATRADFSIRAGETVSFSLIWYPSHLPPPDCRAAEPLLSQTETEWVNWIARANYEGPHRERVERSLITLKLLTYEPTGGIVAAPTTSLPERIGGPRNWDYRFCWVRDATLALYAFLTSGYHAEAEAWRRWVMRAAAGSPQDLQIMYGLHGERRLWEYEIHGLAGFAGSKPVRVGNQAHEQRQLDIYGELVGGIFAAHRLGADSVAESLAAAFRGRRPPRVDLARARQRHLGGARPAPSLHPLQAYGVGRLRPGARARRAAFAQGSVRSLARGACGRPRRNLRARLEREAEGVRAVLRRRGA